MKKKILFVLTVFFIISNLYSMEEPFIFEGIRPLGMGKAFIALADDENAISYNPAGLVHLEDSVISTAMEYYYGSGNSDPVNYYLRTGNYILFARKYFGVALKFNRESTRTLIHESYFEDAMQLRLAGALEIADNFSVGILVTAFYQLDLSYYYPLYFYYCSGVYRFDFDIGAQYSPGENLRIGMLINVVNLGPGESLLFDNNYNIYGCEMENRFPNLNIGVCWIIDNVMNIGFDVNNILEPRRDIQGRGEYLSLKRQYRLGIESGFSEDIVIRCGLRYGKVPISNASHPSSIPYEGFEYKDETSISLGLSYVWNKFIIECALERIAGDDDNSVNAGITYKF